MARRWFGFRDIGKVGFTPPLDTFLQFDVTLGGPQYNDGDTIVRTLFGWRVQTDLTDGAGAPSNPMWPAFVALAYTPDPNGEPQGGAEAPGGALLCREMVAWEEVSWTDGTLHSQRWYGNSYTVISGQGQRIIHDKSIAQLELSFGFDTGLRNFQLINMQAPDAYVLLWAEWLVES